MGLEIIEKVSRGGGKSTWDEIGIGEIKDRAERMIKENGFALVRRDELIEAYKGNASQNYLMSVVRRKVREMFPEDEYNIQFCAKIVARDDEGNIHEFKDVYYIEPVK